MIFGCCYSCGNPLRAHERGNGLCNRCEAPETFREPTPPEPDPHWDRLFDEEEAPRP